MKETHAAIFIRVEVVWPQVNAALRWKIHFHFLSKIILRSDINLHLRQKIHFPADFPSKIVLRSDINLHLRWKIHFHFPSKKIKK